MNPRLVEPGFVVVCLAYTRTCPARPGKDENREDDAQVARQQHGRRQDTCAAGRCARAMEYIA